MARAGTAIISNDPDAGTWTIGSAGLSLTIAADQARDFEIVQLVSRPGKPGTTPNGTDTFVTLGSTTIPFGSRSAGFVYQSVATSVNGSTVQLDVTYDRPPSHLRATRHYRATSGSPILETWTTFAALGGAVAVSNLNAFQLTVPNGTIRWVNGLQNNRSLASAFTLNQRGLEVGQSFSIGATGRSSEESVPWFSIDGDDQFVAGLLWSGAWSLNVNRTTAGLRVTLGLAPMSTTSSTAVDGPHAFFGFARGGLLAASAAVQSFVVEGLRSGRPFEPLVTYNTWFAYGVDIDEASVSAEIDASAALGAELFVLDAGWYTGAGRGGVTDFSSGLGTWQVDSAKFPNGLKSLTDKAHDRGMKFGIWVEPERIALSILGQRGAVQEAWLAKAGGRYGSSDAAQLCLASDAARQWILDQLTRLIDAVQPDYLKWDNNFWINCDRTGHGHAIADGNFAHVNGLYELLESLRKRYPQLSIENVSGGGNRLDLGMLRYTDVAWMDDHSAPSAHVRHDIEGLGLVFPPAYLLSFVMDHPDEPIHQAADFPLYFRSRMAATLGLSYRIAEFEEGDLAQMMHEIDIYKTIRGTLALAFGTPLTPQAGLSGDPPWDIFQTTRFGSRSVLVWAFQSDMASRETLVKPVALRPQTYYDVRSVDTGLLGSATGAELMRDGVSIVASPNSAAHVLIFTAQNR